MNAGQRIGVAALMGSLSCCQPAPQRPDIILIVADTLRRDALGVYGASPAATPKLDSLAAQGVVFEDCIAQCSWTRPSMVSLFQGVHLPSYRDRPAEELSTLAEELSDEGYLCLASGANPLLGADVGFARGFERYELRTRPPEVPEGVPLGGSWQEVWLAADPGVRAAPSDAPLFIYLHLMEPHAPYELDPRWGQELALPDARPLSLRLLAKLKEQLGADVADGGAWQEGLARIQAARHAYSHSVRSLDEGVGLIVDELRSLRPERPKIFLLASDHGEALFDVLAPTQPRGDAVRDPEVALYRDHGQILPEALIRVPLIVFGHGIPRGLRVKDSVQNLDLFPTLIELAGRDPAPTRDGRSLLPWSSARAASALSFASVLHEHAVRDQASGLKPVLPTAVGRSAGRGPMLTSWVEDPAGLEDLSRTLPRERELLEAELDSWSRRGAVSSSLRVSDPAVLRALGYSGPGGDPLPPPGER